MNLQNRRSSRRHVFLDSSESDSEAGGSESTSDEEYGFLGGMGYGGFSDAAREGFYAGYYWESPSGETESNDTSPDDSESTESEHRRSGLLRVPLQRRLTSAQENALRRYGIVVSYSH